MEDKNELETTPETAGKTTKAKKAAEEKAEIFIPRGAANDDPNLFVSVNGVNYLLPKGKSSKVPKHIAEEIKRSWKAEELQDKRIDELKDDKKSE